MSALSAFAETEADGCRIISLGSHGCPTAPAHQKSLTVEEFDKLNRLRWLALKSRLAPKPDIERACFLLAGSEARRIDTIANAFFRGLDSHGTRSIALYRPATPHPSDEEIWLLRMLAAFEAGEEKAGAALVAWRIRPEGRRWMRFLAASLAELLAK